MPARARAVKVRRTFERPVDELNLVSFGGRTTVMALPDHGGLHVLVDEHTTVPVPAGSNAAIKAAEPVAGMIVGAGPIADVDVLRQGRAAGTQRAARRPSWAHIRAATRSAMSASGIGSAPGCWATLARPNQIPDDADQLTFVDPGIPRVRRAGCRVRLLRDDRPLRPSIVAVTAWMSPAEVTTIGPIAEDACTPIRSPHAISDDAQQCWISDAEVVESPFTAFTSLRRPNTSPPG
ncbi:MAG: hypothetical protein M0Z51_13750 [Propionibacterium sp.]|nr:hypothetical protein [Propionibacterium sp.]